MYDVLDLYFSFFHCVLCLLNVQYLNAVFRIKEKMVLAHYKLKFSYQLDMMLHANEMGQKCINEVVNLVMSLYKETWMLYLII